MLAIDMSKYQYYFWIRVLFGIDIKCFDAILSPLPHFNLQQWNEIIEKLRYFTCIEKNVLVSNRVEL